jgi:superfamily II DNA/RNA helicase
VIDAFILFRFASNCSFEEIKRINPDNSAYLCRSIFRMTSFSELGLREELLEAIADLGYTAPTPIQEQSIPLLSEQITDLVALAQTGTGKTAAFGLPLLNILDE